MEGRSLGRIVFALLVIVLAVGIGVSVYNAGVAQGLAESGKIVAPATGVPYVGVPFFFRPWGFGFGLFGWLFPLLFFFLIFGLLRGLFWRGRWGGHRHWESGLPPAFDEWHRREHGETPPSEK
ncbi:MAG: hypothetical protein LC737_06265 [Chloroflexi bacterium]|nr:hypothetical protein [Chloroflexota bacterium]